MKKGIISIVLLVFLISFVSAQIVINEFVVDPKTNWDGSATIGNNDEWVELYNAGFTPINLSGWNLTLNDTTPVVVSLNITIAPNTFFTLLDMAGAGSQQNDGQILLHDNTGNLIDSVTYGNHDDGNLADNAIDGNANSVDNECLSRFPNGADTNNDTNDFIKTKCSFNTANIPKKQQNFTIENKTITPNCSFASNEITLNADVAGQNINAVWFSIIINNIQTNRTAIWKTGNAYQISIPSTELVGGTNLIWNVYANDSYNYLYNNSWITHFIYNKTFLIITPPVSNGNFPWYISEPIFSLFNPNATSVHYRWNGLFYDYAGPFKLEGTPNNGNITGGTHQLTWWANVTCGLESEQNQTFYFDFRNPEIKNFQPSGKITDATPEIYAYLEEKYQSNSGINKSSISMFLDGNLISPVIEPADTIDYTVSYTPAANLAAGIHSVIINATDNAGRNSQLNWTFEILNQTTPSLLNMTIYSPKNGSYSEKRNSFNITTSQIVDRIEYFNDAENNPKWKTLCKNCNEYGFSKKKTINLQDGENNIIIRAVQGAANVQENINLFIDSQPPKISKIEPRSNSVVNGSFFQVKYTEENPVNVILFWNPNVTLQNCPSGRNQVCSTSANLTDFNNQYIIYYFEISDGINNASSKNTTVLVDTTSPQLVINLPQNGTLYRSKVPFNITVSEKSNIEYFDTSSGARWTKLCTNCNEYGSEKLKTKRFTAGNHNLLIRAVDKAGNSDVKEVFFTA